MIVQVYQQTHVGLWSQLFHLFLCLLRGKASNTGRSALSLWEFFEGVFKMISLKEESMIRLKEECLNANILAINANVLAISQDLNLLEWCHHIKLYHLFCFELFTRLIFGIGSTDYNSSSAPKNGTTWKPPKLQSGPSHPWSDPKDSTWILGIPRPRTRQIRKAEMEPIYKG